MSLLDTIKSIFCPKKSDDTESETSSNITNNISEEKEATETTPSPITEQSIDIVIPQDSTLKRHYISTLKVNIETEMGPYPTDTALKKQYDTSVQSQLDQLLS